MTRTSQSRETDSSRMEWTWTSRKNAMCARMSATDTDAMGRLLFRY